MISIDGVGRLVIPKEFRLRLRLQKGSRLRITEDGDSLVLTPVPEHCTVREVGKLLVIDRPFEGQVDDHRTIREERIDMLAGTDR